MKAVSTIFIIHGSYGNPQENWLPWLKDNLEKLGQRVFIPQFPIPQTRDAAYSGHDLEKWLETFKKYGKYMDENTIIVAHSRGCIFIYRLFERLTKPIKATFLVAPWINYHWYPKGWTKIDSFHKTPFDWEKIKKGSRYFEIYQSTNDDTPVNEGREIAQKLNGALVVAENAGHFNTSAGYTSFELLFNNLQKQLS